MVSAPVTGHIQLRDSEEKRPIACSAGVAESTGDSLFVRRFLRILRLELSTAMLGSFLSEFRLFDYDVQYGHENDE